MTPEMSRVVGRIVQAAGLVAGPTLDELLSAADDVDTVEDLPRWAQCVAAVVEE